MQCAADLSICQHASSKGLNGSLPASSLKATAIDMIKKQQLNSPEFVYRIISKRLHFCTHFGKLLSGTSDADRTIAVYSRSA